MIGRFFLYLGEMTAGAVLSEYIIGISGREAVLWLYLAVLALNFLAAARRKPGLDLLPWGIGVFSITAFEGLKVALAVWVAVRILGLGNRYARPAAVISLPVFVSFIYPEDLLLIATTLGVVLINRHLFSLRLI